LKAFKQIFKPTRSVLEVLDKSKQARVNTRTDRQRVDRTSTKTRSSEANESSGRTREGSTDKTTNKNNNEDVFV
jgi:hypothetical protein